MDLEQISRKAIGAAISVHRVLGPGLLESAYEICLAHELASLGLFVERQKPIPVIYRNVKLDCGYRADLIVEQQLIVEVKAVEALARIHEAQLISYLRLTNTRMGLLLNFHSVRLKDGLRRLVNNY